MILELFSNDKKSKKKKNYENTNFINNIHTKKIITKYFYIFMTLLNF